MKACRLVVFLAVILAAVCACECFAPLFAQTAGTGGLTVTVTDPSGAVVPGASVTVTSATGVARTEVTDASGSFTFNLLQPGLYKVSITASGFKISESDAVRVDVTETHVLPAKLEIGSNTQEVTVTSEVQAVQTDNATLGTVTGSQSMTELPLSSRNYQQILTLSPGVTAAVTDATVLGRASPFIFTNGLSNVSNDYQMDGVTITNYPNGVADESSGFYGSMAVPNPDALQEFKVQTSNYDSGYGRNAGANVNVVMKSGTNDWHGSAFEYFRNTVLNANNWFSNRSGVARGALDQNQYGGAVGGPLKKDKVFFFASYQGTNQKNGVSTLGSSTVPLPEQLTQITPAIRSGSAAALQAALGAAFCPTNNIVGGAAGPGYIYSVTQNGGSSPTHLTGTVPTDEVQCNGSNINPVTVALFQQKNPDGSYIIPVLTPAQLAASGSATTGQLAVSLPATFKEKQALGSMDFVINSKETLTLRYYYSYSPLNSAFPVAGQPEGGGQIVLGGNQLAMGKLTSLLTNNLVNEVRFSFYYVRAGSFVTDPIRPSQVGINLSPSWLNVMPVINTGVFSFGGSSVSGSFEPQGYWEWSDQLSWNHGKHTIRTGYDEQRIAMLNRVTFPERGSATFPTWADFLIATSAANNGTTLSNLSAAAITSTTVGGATNQLRNNLISTFLQDDIKLNSRLTVNAGLRWEYDGLEYDGLGNAFEPWVNLLATDPIPPASGTFIGYTVASNYAYNPNNPPLPSGIFTRPVKTLSENDTPLKNFSPRLGFAWQPLANNNKLVIRGGAGRFYNLIHGNVFQIITNSGPPVAVAASYSGAAEVNGTFQNPVSPIPALNFQGALRFPSAAAATAAGFGTNQAALSYGEVAQNVVTPEIYTWNLDSQYGFGGGWLGELAYVATRGEHIYTGAVFNVATLAVPGVAGINDTNPPQAGVNCANTAANLGPGCITTNTFANANMRTPVVGFKAGGLSTGGNFGDVDYQSVQASIRKTFTHGFQVQASYTFGRNLTDVSGAAFSGGSGGAVSYFNSEMTNPNNPNDYRLERSNSDYIRPQRLIVNYIYQFPNVQGARGIVGRALSGWGMSGVSTFQSGSYITFTDANSGGAYGVTTGAAYLCPGDSISGILANTGGTIQSRVNNYFNKGDFGNANPTFINGGAPWGCAFPLVANHGTDTTKATAFGNLGRAIVRGPDQNNWDLSLTKKTIVGGIHEDSSLEFRADFFNAFNHAQFSNPGSAVSTPGSFGVVSTTSVGNRVIQFALKYAF